jgi:NAD+ synthase
LVAPRQSDARGAANMIADRLKITCVQANPTVGDLQGNLDIVRRYRTRFRDTDLLIFTECFLSGYPLGDLVLRPGFLRDVRMALADFAAEIAGDNGPAILIGAPQEGAVRAFNAAFLIDNDGTIQVTQKRVLPNEEVYDERRTFAAGQRSMPLRFRGFYLGVLICEDFWHGDSSRSLAEEGANVLIVPNGSHFRIGKQRERLDLAARTVRALGLPVIYVNQVCGQDELVFDGGSFAMDTHANVLAEVAFREAAFSLSLVREGHGIVLSAANSPSDGELNFYPDELDAAYYAMMLGLRDYVRKSGFPGVVIGMSGGIDSALSAAVAADALGPDKVMLVRMPSPYTSAASMDDAAEAARLLGTRLETIGISPAMEAFGTMLAPSFQNRAPDSTEENIQARARGMTLMALSNKLGLMVLSTGNKSEMSVGYATLYGDMCGGYSVLKDAYKTTIFALARRRNGWRPQSALGPEGPVIPQQIIDKPPSAELKPDQTDEAALGAYAELDAVLRHMVEGLNGPARAAALASEELGTPVPVEYAERIARMVWRAQYKREQAPPGVVLTERNYGKGWRLPIVNHYGL